VRGYRQKTIPALLERYELKFLIPAKMIEPISAFASVYCSPDTYSDLSEDGFYRVNSLYLDSPDFLFLKMRLADLDNRINMRVRSYGDTPELPYFLEIKQKKSGVIRKYRSAVTDKNWFKAYTEPGYMSSQSNNTKTDINRLKFERLVFTYNAEPKILTQYLRKAMVSDVDEYARITFDKALKYTEETLYNPIPVHNRMNACDHTDVFEPDCEVILELKCYTASVPLWMVDMIRYFNLQRGRFSKYATGAGELLSLHTYDTGSRISALI